jgi:hypothetical protein
MKSTKRPLIAICALCFLALTSQATQAAETPAQPTEEGSSSDQSSPEYQAIANGTRKYEEAYNKGDAKELANFYAEDVDYIDSGWSRG